MIEKIMTKNIITATVNDDIYTVSKIMKKYDIGFLPIVDKNKIKGVITDRDIVINCLANIDNNNIENYISKRIITLPVSSDIDDVLKVMGQEKVKRVIINDNKKVVGIISLSDIINNYKDDDKIIKTIKKIYKIDNHNFNNSPEVDEFYL